MLGMLLTAFFAFQAGRLSNGLGQPVQVVDHAETWNQVAFYPVVRSSVQSRACRTVVSPYNCVIALCSQVVYVDIIDLGLVSVRVPNMMLCPFSFAVVG